MLSSRLAYGAARTANREPKIACGRWSARWMFRRWRKAGLTSPTRKRLKIPGLGYSAVGTAIDNMEATPPKKPLRQAYCLLISGIQALLITDLMPEYYHLAEKQSAPRTRQALIAFARRWSAGGMFRQTGSSRYACQQTVDTLFSVGAPVLTADAQRDAGRALLMLPR